MSRLSSIDLLYAAQYQFNASAHPCKGKRTLQAHASIPLCYRTHLAEGLEVNAFDEDVPEIRQRLGFKDSMTLRGNRGVVKSGRTERCRVRDRSRHPDWPGERD